MKPFIWLRPAARENKYLQDAPTLNLSTHISFDQLGTAEYPSVVLTCSHREVRYGGHMELNILDLGRCEYAKALAIQLETVESVQCGRTGDTLILVEHPAIITLGRNAKPENLLATNMQLNSMGIDLQSVTRGGDITYHGPGQLVGYPIFHLKERHGGSIRMFVNRLESVLMDVLQEEWQITSGRDSCNSGVWVGNDKIAAIGLAVKRGVTMHGFSLNLSTDLSHYSTMIPCGLQGRGVTTVERLVGHPVSLESAPSAVIRNFRKHYGFDR